MVDPLLTALRACVHLAGHLIVAVFWIVCFYGIQHLLTYLGQPHELTFFDVVPVRYIVDAADLGVLAAFAIRGTMMAFIGSEAKMNEFLSVAASTSEFFLRPRPSI